MYVHVHTNMYKIIKSHVSTDPLGKIIKPIIHSPDGQNKEKWRKKKTKPLIPEEVYPKSFERFTS